MLWFSVMCHAGEGDSLPLPSIVMSDDFFSDDLFKDM